MQGICYEETALGPQAPAGPHQVRRESETLQSDSHVMAVSHNMGISLPAHLTPCPSQPPPPPKMGVCVCVCVRACVRVCVKEWFDHISQMLQNRCSFVSYGIKPSPQSQVICT